MVARHGDATAPALSRAAAFGAVGCKRPRGHQSFLSFHFCLKNRLRSLSYDFHDFFNVLRRQTVEPKAGCFLRSSQLRVIDADCIVRKYVTRKNNNKATGRCNHKEEKMAQRCHRQFLSHQSASSLPARTKYMLPTDLLT